MELKTTEKKINAKLTLQNSLGPVVLPTDPLTLQPHFPSLSFSYFLFFFYFSISNSVYFITSLNIPTPFSSPSLSSQSQ